VLGGREQRVIWRGKGGSEGMKERGSVGRYRTKRGGNKR
jgi:hypothetical protein